MLQFRICFLCGIKVKCKKILGIKKNVFRLLGGQYTQWNKNSTVWKIRTLKEQMDICSASKGFFS